MIKMGRLLLEADTDMQEFDWLDKMTDLTTILKKKKSTGYWKVIGVNLGWNKASGSKYIIALNGSALMTGILPKASCSFKVYNFGAGILIINDHHDAMGEKYYIMQIAESTYTNKPRINVSAFLENLRLNG